HRPTVRSPAIYAWQQHGLGVDQPDSGVAIESVDVPGDGRFHIGRRAIDEGDGLWRYEYAVHNMNSDRAAGGFVVPIPDGVTVSGIGFKDVDRHSGEELVYDNTDWIITTAPGEVRW